MPTRSSTLYTTHNHQQPFTLVFQHEAWHISFPNHQCELEVHGTHIEAQAVARCYWSLFLAPGAPLAFADMAEGERLDLAEREAAIEIEVQQHRMEALLYSTSGDGGLLRIKESKALYVLGQALQKSGHLSPCMVREAERTHTPRTDRGDGRDSRGRFVSGGTAARECGRAGFEKVVYEILPQRYPDAVNARGVHMAFNFMNWLHDKR